MASEKSWARTPGTYIAGRAYIDGADETAAEMEAKWGCDRLRLLVGPELREKFDRQRYLLNQAIWHGELEAVRRESGRMVMAWQALDRAAVAAASRHWRRGLGSPAGGRDGGRDRPGRCAGACRGRRGAARSPCSRSRRSAAAFELSRHRQGQADVSGARPSPRSGGRSMIR
jgi:hypothetical protein